jgi:hypothetical protein
MDEDFVAWVDACKTGWVCFRLYETGAMAVDVVNVTEVLVGRPDGLKALVARNGVCDEWG